MVLPDPPENIMAFWGWVSQQFPTVFDQDLRRAIHKAHHPTSRCSLEKSMFKGAEDQCNAFGASFYDKKRAALVDLVVLMVFIHSKFFPEDTTVPNPTFDDFLKFKDMHHAECLELFPPSAQLELQPEKTPTPTHSVVKSLPPAYQAQSPLVITSAESRLVDPTWSHGDYQVSAPTVLDSDGLPLRRDPRGGKDDHGRMMDNNSLKSMKSTLSKKSRLQRTRRSDGSQRHGNLSPDGTPPMDVFMSTDESSHNKRRTPWSAEAKPRKPLNDRVTWNGHAETFRVFKRTIEGHLIQCQAGYLVHGVFINNYFTHGEDYLNSMEFWNDFSVPFRQAKADREWLFGMLMSACKSLHNKIINRHTHDKDGVIAWWTFKQDYDNNGAESLTINRIGN